MSGRQYGFVRKAESKAKREKQYQLVLDLAALLEHEPKGLVHDTALLPHPKAELVEALLEFIKTAKSPQFVQTCEIFLIAINKYQYDIGEKSITMIELPDGLDPQAVKFALKSSGFDRWEFFSDGMAAELADFKQRMMEARSANLHLQPAWKKAWQKFWKEGLHSPFYEGYDFP